MDANIKAIGKKAYKKSGKPFKSGEKVGTVKGIVVNPNSGKYAFTFEEDETVVDCFRCKLLLCYERLDSLDSK